MGAPLLDQRPQAGGVSTTRVEQIVVGARRCRAQAPGPGQEMSTTRMERIAARVKE